MALIYKGNRNPNGGRVLKEYTLVDSGTFTIGDVVKFSSGKLDLVGAGNAIAGVIESILKANGAPVTDNGAGGRFTDTYTTGSSNTVKAKIDVSLDSEYSAPLDATIGTTTGSNLGGYNIDLVAASDTLDEDMAGTGTAQMFIWGVDPENTARAIVSIQESQVKI